MKLRFLLSRIPRDGCYYSRFAFRVASLVIGLLCFVFIVNSLLRTATQLSGKLNRQAHRDSLAFGSGEHRESPTQELQRLAKHLQLVYDVSQNTGGSAATQTVVIYLKNPLKTPLGAGIRWRMYFSLMHPVMQYQASRGCGDKLGFIVRHVNGYLHYLQLDGEAAAAGLPPGNDCFIVYTGVGSVISRYDAFPNWYLVPLMPPDYTSESPQAVVVECTAGIDNQFVAPFLTPAQFKRGSSDAHSPWTPEERDRRRLAYLGGSEPSQQPSSANPTPVRLVPTPVLVRPLSRGQSALSTVGLLSAARFRGEVGCDPAEPTLAYLQDRQKLLTPASASSAAADALDVSLCSRSDEATLTASLTDANQPALKPFQRRGAYLLRFHPDRRRVDLRAFSPEGLFAAAQTLLTLLHDPGPPLATRLILDYPRFDYRGLMIDVARNFQPLPVLLRIVDVMALYKMNKLHLHLTDDEAIRLPITEAYKLASRRCHDPTAKLCLPPQLGSHPTDGNAPGSGYYTSTEYAQLLKYAADRFIEIIPEVDMPAHAHALIASHRGRAQLTDPADPSRPVSVQNFHNNSLNPCMPDTRQLIRRIISDLVRLHSLANIPLATFNFGGDEPPGEAWQFSPACLKLGLNTRDAINRFFLGSVVGEQAGRDKLALIGWEDGYVVKDADKRPYNLSEIFSQPAGARPKDTLVLSWLNQMAWGSGDLAYKFANTGYKVVLAHATHLYLDHQQEPDPEERGLYWATRYIDLRKAFEFDAVDIYANMREDIMGQPVDVAATCAERGGCASLNQPDNIVGLTGALWGETLLADRLVFPMLLPRLLAIAERAWHRGQWEGLASQPELRDGPLAADWTEFVNAVSQRELSRLARLGIRFHLPPPGAKLNPVTRRVRLSHQTPHNVRLFYAFTSSLTSRAGEHWEEAKHGDDLAVPGSAALMLLKAGFGDSTSRHEIYVESRTVKLPLTASAAAFVHGAAKSNPPANERPARDSPLGDVPAAAAEAASTAMHWLLFAIFLAAVVCLTCLTCCWINLQQKAG